MPGTTVSRPVRRATARATQQHGRRQAVHAAPLAGPAPAAAPAGGGDAPLYATVEGWLDACLTGRGHPRPARKRLGLLVSGLLAGERGTPHGITHAAFGLGIGTATQEASVARRVSRLLDDPQLDPARLVPALATAVLPTLLQEVCAAHDASVGTRAAHAAPGGHHGKWVGVTLVVDETSKADETHVLVVGLAYRGVVVPLGVRTWPQNQALPEGTYWPALAGVLWEVAAVLPPVLRAHVLVLADRGYGVPAFLDLLASLGWHWVVRVAGPVRVRLPDGTERALRTLVPAPGTVWTGGSTPARPDGGDGDAPLAVFKKAGWRHVQVVAAWMDGQDEPWLLVTTLRADPARLRDYARRWGIERLFLAWKRHGWDLEAGGVPQPARLARLLTGYIVATWWLLAAALPGAQATLDLLASQAARRTGQPPPRACQLHLPLAPPARPWAAKASLLTQGRRAFRRIDGRTATPLLCWSFPEWEAPTWALHCHQVAHGALL